MKIFKLFLLGLIFSQAIFSQTSTNRYLYSYDSAGNIISRFRTFLGRVGHDDMSDNDNTSDDDKTDSRITIKTDATWSEVKIEIISEITPGDMLSIFSSDGLFVTSSRIVSNTFTLNLSTLHKGTYLFRFKLSRKMSRIKLFKQN